MTLLTRNGSPLVLSDSLDGLLPDLRAGDVVTWPGKHDDRATVTRVQPQLDGRLVWLSYDIAPEDLRF